MNTDELNPARMTEFWLTWLCIHPPTFIADTQILASKVDLVLLVIQPRGTHIEAARSSMDMFKRAGARGVGVVMN